MSTAKLPIQTKLNWEKIVQNLRKSHR
jgi:hypothetical protein